MGKWDSFAKRLIGSRPGQYVSWLISGALFVEALNIELKAQEFLADALLKVLIAGQLALLHIEFQSYEDPTMGRRMVEYNVIAEHQYGLPVSSFVIYLRKRRVPKPPYIRTFVDGHVTHHFYYRVVKLWEIPAQVILDLDWEGLLPLLPLTKGGKKPEIIQIMIDRLSHDRDLLALAEMYGGLAFTSESEKARFKRRFAMFQDIMKDSWVYQEIVQASEERGIQSHRQAIVDIVNKRFPLLNELAFQQVARVTDLDALRILVVNISVEDNEEAVRRLLMDAVKK
ncbi:MAG: hypothetical protein ABI413_18985 [Ktedonobacteraceae bacterium]